MAERNPPTETMTLVFTDVVASTALATEVGTERADVLMRAHLEALDEEIGRAGGRRVKRLGDGTMAAFTSASAAIGCAVAMQRSVDATGRGRRRALRMRIGIGAGDVLVEGDDYAGAPVVEAARLCALAEGGQILATQLVDRLGGGRARAAMTPLGPRELKGLPEPVEVVEVAWSLPTPDAPPGAGTTGPLHEREEELAVLEDALTATAEGRGCVVVIEGRAGTGKTRLLDAVRETVTDTELLVLSARGAELEREYGWGVVHQLFERWLLAQGTAEQGRLLRGSAESARSALGELTDGTSDEPFGAVHGLYWLVVHAVEDSPVALVVDDAHWADEASLRWLAYLTARMDGLPLAVVIATRAEHEARREPLLQIANGPSARTLRPRPLSVAATTALLAARPGLGDHVELAIACHEATRGNPFLLHALIGDLAEVGSAQAPDPNTVRALRPQAISRSVLLRLGRLGPEARAVAGAVAVLGGAATLARTATLADLPTEAVARAASALAGADLFDESVTLAFAHPLVQAVVLDDMPTLERAAAHARAAAALEATGARPQEVAAQLLETVPAGDAGVVEALTRAAEDALARGAPDAAATFLQRAAREPPAPERRASVLRLLGRALTRARGAAGLGPLREAIDAEPRAVPRAETALELARALEVLSRNREAVDVYDRALSALGDSEPALALTLRAGLAVAAVEHLSTLPRAVEILAADAARVEGGGPHSPVIGALVALAASAAGSPEGVTLATAALADGELFDVEPSIATGLAIEQLLWADRFDDALRAWEEVIARARHRGGVPRMFFAVTYRAHVHLRAGRLADAEDDARAALTFPEEMWVASAVPVDTPALLAQVLIERGALAEAQALLEPAGPARELSDYQGNNLLLMARGALRLAQARAGDAAEDLLELGRRCEAWGLQNPAALAWRSHAALALRVADPGRARELAAQEVELARAFGAPRALGIGLRAAGLVADGAQGTRCLEEAVDVLASSPAILERARALVSLGAALRRSGHTSRARDPLSAGLDLAASCGADPLAKLARAELRAAGARPRRDRINGRDALTASERRVARLAADGHTNREIAEELWITLKTVETHLGRTYRKLDVPGRRKLAAALATDLPTPG